MELNDFFLWLMSSGGAVLAFSWIAERIEKWHALSATKKEYYSFGGSAFLALSAWAILEYVPPAALEAIAVPFSLVAGIFVLIFVKDVFHAQTKK